jgi:hypothetical protein
VIAEVTRRQTGELFDLEDLGLQRLVGFAHPQRVWRVSGESGEVSRVRGLALGETPLVGALLGREAIAWQLSNPRSLSPCAHANSAVFSGLLIAQTALDISKIEEFRDQIARSSR